MKVRRVYHPQAESIEGWESLHEAALRMRERGLDCLPVMAGQDLVGIVTERDIVDALAESEHLQSTTVFDCMTETPRTIYLDDDCALAATRMLAAGCRHLPVMDGGKVVGVISARDLMPLAAADYA